MNIRRAVPEDAETCGRICYEAFADINRKHGFPPDVPNPETGIGVLTMMFGHPGFYCVVAEADGRLVGSNCLDERSPIAGIGPITVDPAAQNGRIGRQLMDAVLDRVRERGCPGVRLVQSAFHGRSLSLYAKLGFDVREPLSVMQGPALQRSVEGYVVRAATIDDVDAASRVCEQVHGHHRAGELRDAVTHGTAAVVEHGGRITGYTSGVGFFGHSVAESDTGLQALISAAPAFGGPGFLLPTRRSAMYRWCLANRLRVVEPLTLMTMGLYNEPVGAYLPSILY
jgi:GNAT superfamily N-acetyltransferase